MSRRPQPNINANYNIKGGYWLYGQHAVQAALQNRKRQKLRLLATADAYATVLAKLDAPLKIVHETIDRSTLDTICGKEAVHQGIALHVMPLGSASAEDMLERSGPILMLDQVTDPRNIGAILRSAVAFGAAGVILQDRHSPDESGAMAKAASGGLDTIPIMRAVNLSRELTKFKEAGLWAVGLDAHGNLLNGADYAQRRVILVLGAEGAGIRQLTKKNCDEIASLRMTGDIDSLNVSVAGAIALYEITRSFF
ncbi:23S rRNA (guanosine(2251)-2'-O)-methyltransferase RlmB [Commensalibacter papalotli (ex Botero et al. 2024)]|uniref:tRNA G18 (Ribose-2'-O)-methylase SpoU (SpoU) (PDB:1GZ0) n=1 Tax=Commensalibacter papalotli (ex Botero et al. 2024) TaxID=2972766 RepID=A0ABN8W4B4_9PROT|nr:23S rRNA (guanosine(2251)-2'-O)-methyltransferase RlmB [Commensalibacter papalotli (ex Botero et al. 2024)]CAI3932516.1 tRNA G18 (ribose-2'-O)-methylase SpoU (SpoU) (PDB:1GZ0) [Commensalibacter papalotli (ex Botero et al. 2024)]CAI3946175.1 tRNA G18 (ribose-2'-O)-methylase SpoU (SpoU) (PDB:1GZ0) [Commensalibacter papalotli (ex Botero et al. 2024)]